MSSENSLSDWSQFQLYILQLEQEGRVSRTFRRLDAPRQQRIVQAILDEAALKGPASLNIKEVARRAEVSVGSLYTYFPDRNGMLDFAVDLCVRFICDAFHQFRSYLEELPLEQALGLYLSGGIEWSQEQAGLLQLFARAAYQGDPDLGKRLVQPIAEEMLKMVRDMLEAAFRRGELRAGLDLEAATRLIHGLSITAADSQLLPYLNNYFQAVSEDVPFPRLSTALIDLVLQGISSKN